MLKSQVCFSKFCVSVHPTPNPRLQLGRNYHRVLPHPPTPDSTQKALDHAKLSHLQSTNHPEPPLNYPALQCAATSRLQSTRPHPALQLPTRKNPDPATQQSSRPAAFLPDLKPLRFFHPAQLNPACFHEGFSLLCVTTL